MTLAIVIERACNALKRDADGLLQRANDDSHPTTCVPNPRPEAANVVVTGMELMRVNAAAEGILSQLHMRIAHIP
jgi:hypothetical protein